MSFFTEVNRDALSVSIDAAAVSPLHQSFLRNFEIANEIDLTSIVAIGVVIVVGIVLARATLVVSRGPGGRHVIQSHPLSSLIGLSSNVSVFAAMITGFFVTHWYWPSGFLVLAFVLSGLAINGVTAVAVYKINDVIGLTVTATAFFLAWKLWN